MAVKSNSVVVAKDSLPEVQFLVPRSVLDRTLSDLEMLDFLRENYPEVLRLKEQYKAGLKLSLRIENIQKQEIKVTENIIELSQGSYQTMRSRVVKLRMRNFLENIKNPILVASGFFVGYLTAKLL